MGYDKVIEYNIEREKRIDEIKDLYKNEISPEHIDEMAKLASCYGGTVLSRAILDLYDSLIYGEKPKGPDQDMPSLETQLENVTMSTLEVGDDNEIVEIPVKLY